MPLFLLLYYLLLVVWLPLLWPLLRLKGRARIWLSIVAVAGLTADLYEIRMTFWTTNAIRLDILLVSVLLGGLYGAAVLVLLRTGWRKGAALLGVALALIAGGMVYEWVQLGQESQRLRETFKARDRLLFDARFRDRETYERRFGPFADAPAALPAGHWQVEGESHFTRLIVNARGRAWLLFRCGDTECLYAAQGALLQRDAKADKGWRATLSPRAAAPLALRLSREGPDRLALETDRLSARLTRTPPPLNPQPAARALTFLGAFAGVACRGAHAAVRQLWLWREGPRLYAGAVVATLLAGRRADFVSPLVLGEGVGDGETWRFDWQRDGQSWHAAVDLRGPQPLLTLVRAGAEPESIALAGAPFVRDPVIALAPLTSKADWAHWFEVVLTGHFASGEVPAC